MPSLFTRIINREIPGRFVFEDDQCVAFLTIAPIRPGHTLVVPRAEIDHWLDLPPALTAHLFPAAPNSGPRGIQHAFPCEKIGLIIAGLEVPHTHLHLVPCDSIGDLDFAKQDPRAKARGARCRRREDPPGPCRESMNRCSILAWLGMVHGAPAASLSIEGEAADSSTAQRHSWYDGAV